MSLSPWNALGYSMQILNFAVQTYSAYWKGRELWENPEQRTVCKTVDCATSCLAATVQGASIVNSIQTDQAFRQKEIINTNLEKHRKEELKAKEKLVNLVKSSPEASTSLVETIDSLSNGDEITKMMRFAFLSLQLEGDSEFLKNCRGLYAASKSSSSEYYFSDVASIKLDNQLARLHKTSNTLNLLDASCQITKEFCKDNPLAGTMSKIQILQLTIKIYVDHYPNTKISKLIKKNVDLDRVITKVEALISLASVAENSLRPSSSEQRQIELPDEIPEMFENDPTLLERICPITQSPIRYPVFLVGANGVPILFEGVALYEYCTRMEETNRPLLNPVTRAPFNAEEIQEDIFGKAIIENRLRTLIDQMNSNLN